MNRSLTQVARAALALALLFAGRPADAAAGAAIYVAGEATGNLEVFNQKGSLLDGGDIDYNVSDGFAVGDVNGDGADDIVVAGDFTHEVEIRQIGNVDAAPVVWNGNFYLGNALAVGDVLPGGGDEIVIAGQFSNDAEIYSGNGTLLATVFVDFTPLDEFAVGDVDGDGMDELLVAGDANGYVDVFEADGTQIAHLDLGFSVDDGFAAGNVDGVGADEIIIAGNINEDVEIYDLAGTLLSTFDADYTTSDGFAVGDVDGDGKDDIAVAGDATDDVDVFDMAGTKTHHFDGDFTVLDGFAIGRNAWPDQDADGLLDGWEVNGFDGDGDTVPDVDLAAAGCKPDHKDLLLEFDWVIGQEPLRWRIQAIKQAFALAPIDAGGTPNPDGQPGIHLVIDTGSLTDGTALEGNTFPAGSCYNGLDDDRDGSIDGMDDTCVESGPAVGPSCRDFFDNDGDGLTDDKDPDCREGLRTCSDGVDNDANGLTDADDPLCVVGDDLGGGNGIALSSGPDDLGTTFYAAKQANFSSLRRRIFRYGISGDPTGQTTGGRGEIGGNDFIEYNHDPGTIMHELGHTLNLRHGGADDGNCKPNFLSVMNYDHQGGIAQAKGPRILDYSPPRRSDGSRGDALPTIEENHLDDGDVLDPADGSSMIIFTDHSDNKIQSRVNRPVDWGGDGGTADSDSTVNIDDEGADGNPAACGNIIVTDTLEGHDDWSVVQLAFRGSTDYDDAAVNPVVGDEPTMAEMNAHDRILQRTNLAVTVTDSADPAVAGETLQYMTTVRNLGPNPTSVSQVRLTLPAGVTHVDTPGCGESGGTVTCDVDMFFPGEERTFTTIVAIDADLVHLAGAPTPIAATATVKNHAGDDPVAANDVGTQATLIEAVADLEALGATTAGAPLELLVGESASFTVRETLTSHGPSSPMDVRVTRTVAASAGMPVSLGAASVLVPALGNGEIREIVTPVTATCAQAGKQSLAITSSVAPDRPDDTDPLAANDDAIATVAIECVVPVSIRIRPTMSEGRKGVVPVEVRSNEAGAYGLPLAFDASLIDAPSVRFAARTVAWMELGGAFEAHGRTHGGADRTLHFATEQAGLTRADGEACVKGTFTEPDGDVFKFFGCDATDWTRQ